MKNIEEIGKAAKLVFAAYPKAKDFHFTADGQAFSEPSDAAAHAGTLDNKAVIKVTREMVISGKIEVPTSDAPSGEEEKGNAKNEFQDKGAKGSTGLGDQGTGDPEREALVKKHEELTGKKPAANIGMDTLRARVEELEKAAAAAGSSEGDANKNQE